MASKTDKVHDQIWTRFGLRVVASNREGALLVSDTHRAVYTFALGGPPFRVAWYEAIRDRLSAGEKPIQDVHADYRQYAR